MKKLHEPARVSHVLFLAVGVVVLLGGWYTIVQATLIDGPDIILAPASVERNPDGATNSNQQAFAERQGVTLSRDIGCDSTIVTEGTLVNSHMIFFNNALGGTYSDLDQDWTFEGNIICVMSSGSGIDQASSNDLFAAPGTVYPGPFPGRGMEGADSYQVNGNTITVSMIDEEPGDWIRVITEVVEPPDTLPPVVTCTTGVNPGGNANSGNNQGKNDGGFLEFAAVDNVDGPVEITITDTESGQVLGPVPSGSTVKHTIASGAVPLLRVSGGDIDYQLKTQGAVELSATDSLGNTETVLCE